MKHIYKSMFGITSLMMFVTLVVFAPTQGKAQEVTGLNDWVLYIDQGHSQQENMGLFNYSEAEKVLRVGLDLREMFIEQTDIEAVYVARETDDDYITLGGRVDEANTLATDFYYSIHSDAGPPHVNSTLMLYGGWKSNGVLVEKTPEGGAAYGEILDWDLTGAMRIGRRGNYADRVFYQGNVHHHDNQWPFLYVNRVTIMASLLSEAGFHTNPGQQMLNLNREWKTLEALSAFRSFLEWHDLDRPAIGVATGIVRDIESGKALNDVTVTIGDQIYTTDGWESLFNQYSNNPEQLRNGFYFIQDLEPLSTVEVTFEKEGYQPLNVDLFIESNPNGLTEENLSFLDVEMVSFIPPVVLSVAPAGELENLIPGTPLVFTFSRKMDMASVEEAFTLSPEAEVSFSWPDAFTLVVSTADLDYLETYNIIIDGSIAKNELTGQYLDGNMDGEEGGDFEIAITMSDLDNEPPLLLEYSPSETSPARVLRPIIRLVYDEEIIEESIPDHAIMLHETGTDFPIEGIIHHFVVNDQSVLHFFPTMDLEAGAAYTVDVAEGLSDMFGNETEAFTFQFYILEQQITHTQVIDNFNDGINNWWHPNQAGQTAGIITELTSRTANGEVVNHSVGSTGSMKLSYGWDPGHGEPYIRLYLPPTASQNNNRFNINHILQVYIFGDGSNNEFRLVIRDGDNQLEGQEWVKIDWTGWKLVSWDLANEPAFGVFGLGNGVLEGANFYMDGFHLRKGTDAHMAGAIYFDHLHFVAREAVDYPTELYENFQNYEDFTTDLFPWITIDVDGDVTWNPSGFTFPGSGDPYAFKVMNPAATTPPIAGNHPPVDGDKYLIAMMSQALNENKWLISPQIKATEISELSFYAKSIEVATYGPERIRVLVLPDDREQFEFDPDDFILISEGDYIEVPAAWTRYSFYLGAYADEVIRFAIQYVSHDDYMLMLDKIEVAPSQTYTLTLEAQPEEGGTVSGQGEYAENQEVEVIATPATGYHFVKWTNEDGDELSNDASYTFQMPAGNLHLIATFEKTEYELTITVEPEESGTVTGEGIYFFDEEVTVAAFPGVQYEFLSWTDRDGNLLSEDEVYMFSMPAYNLQLTANFAEKDDDDTGIHDSELAMLLVYPNPVSDKLHIRSQETIRELSLVDLTGRVLVSARPGDKNTQMEVTHLEQGLYILKITTPSQTLHMNIFIAK
ncbi:MAG: choice-of-anchor J domain-containing protein [Bacteroidales bacterium]|nr:choice-of-anchor J domain-containing protein [Bacteroidales bacterium]